MRNRTLRLKPDASKNVSVKVTLPDTLDHGAYTIVARVDTANAVVESDELNNEAASEGDVL
ncbi:MAG: hypothetical protein CMJ18_27635, partial [Phycisphaeraceae bacterium]|nr:hypothetical protein [Phycisphaeraceae bacterium]